MGTNYYWTNATPPCPTCGAQRETRLHIGKSSAGWNFLFHGTDEIRSWADWWAVIRTGTVENEYGDTLNASALQDVVENRAPGLQCHLDAALREGRQAQFWKDQDGFVFCGGEFS